MNILIVLISAALAWATPPPSLANSRDLAAKLTARLPSGAGPLLCVACDAEWSAGGEPVRRIERVLASALTDARAANLETPEQLGLLLADHFTKLLVESAGDKKPTTTGKETLCAFSRPPCGLFSATLFAEFCTPPEGL